jgi:hypothetical protein
MKRSSKRAYAARRICRWGTSPLRTLPDFMVLGAQKGGTTFFYRLLAQHPNVKPAFLKEVHYFDLNYRKGEHWYRSNFPLQVSDERDFVTGESSPYYLFHPHAPRRAAHIVPEAKLIVLLRNPVHRAYSHYQHQVKRVKGEARETLTFEEAIDAEEVRLHGEVDKMIRDEAYVSLNHRSYSYLARGVYVDQLVAWSKYYDRTQMQILKSEDLFHDTPTILRATSGFLEIPYWAPKAYSIPNKREYTDLSIAVRQRLEDFFRPHNLRLYEYLGVDLGW